ncbi:MAG: YciI family protein [Mycobacteriales bacterium]
MQYMVSVIQDGKGSPGPSDMAAVGAFNERLKAAGHWVFANGLAEPAAASVVDNRGDELVVTDGPFLETKEYVVGLWIMQAPDLDVALRLAAEASKVCDGKLEVRPCAS